MKHTELFGLNQWELSDLVRMEDFNADNARLEEALAGLKERADAAGDSGALETKLGRTETLGTTYENVPRSVIYQSPQVGSWDDWDIFGMFFHTDTSQCDETDTFYFSIRSNSWPVVEEKITLPAGPMLVLLFPWHNRNNKTRGVIIGKETAVVYASFAFQDIDNFVIGLESGQGHKLLDSEMAQFGLR